MSGADRTRRYRQRLRSGAINARTDYPPAVIEFLVDLGWLLESESEQPNQIAAAAMGVLAQAASDHLRNKDANCVTTLHTNHLPGVSMVAEPKPRRA